eukprot:NODE_219_length_12440_cov_2.445588.p1 type:complete len:637 gc:universal NODE_219_length_12440_cov_2.445588:6108-4198(-)
MIPSTQLSSPVEATYSATKLYPMPARKVADSFRPKKTRTVKKVYGKSVGYFYDIEEMRMMPLHLGRFPEKKHAKSIMLPISSKLVRAAFKRLNFISDRIMQLSWKQVEIRKRLILFQHRKNQRLVQIKADMEYKQSLAYLRRQTYLWRRVEKSASAVEKAITICNLRKLQKAQAIGRQNSKNTVKKLNDNSEIIASYTKTEKCREKAPLDLKHLMPPISRFTLRELDVTEIYSNMQLRHDLIFDQDLQFRPNTEGEKGSVKSIRATQYWNQIEKEIFAVNNNSGEFVRMPILIREIKEIMLEMFPDAEDVEAELKSWDVDAIVERLSDDMDNGVPYIFSLAKIMHIYCAPCRDELIDDMVALYQARFHVDALNKCLAILEHMRLDFANHNLRKLRPLIALRAPEFEWRYFKQQLETNQISTVLTKNWIKQSLNDFKLEKLDKSNFYDFAIMKIITNSYMCETFQGLPETFRFDQIRLNQLHNDWQDISIMNTLLILFKQFASRKCTTEHLQKLKKILWLILNDAQTTMDNVTTQLANDAGIVRGFPLTNLEKKILNQLVDRTLSVDSEVYLVIQKRVSENVLEYMMESRFNESKLKRSNSLELKEELIELSSKIKKLMNHNQETFKELYTMFCKSL